MHRSYIPSKNKLSILEIQKRSKKKQLALTLTSFILICINGIKTFRVIQKKGRERNMKEKLITGSTSFLEKKDEVHIKKMDIRMFVCLVCTMRENE